MTDTEKLSPSQQIAYSRLTDKPQTAYHLQVGLTTLNALVAKGFAKDVTPSGPGGMFSPATHFQYVKAPAK